MNTSKTHIEDCNFKDIQEILGRKIAVLPWGACEPHGEQLSYCTDTILATVIAKEAVSKSKRSDDFMILPAIPFGSQNIGQFNKKFCIHMSIETQKMILLDMLRSFSKQLITTLVIINGHNGNNFKTIVRDLEMQFDIKIYVCNYLDIASKEFMKTINGAPDVDDHAGFTETSLMMHYFPDKVHMENLAKNEKEWYPKPNAEAIWTPRDWDKSSWNTRVGDPRNASAEAGKKIAEHVTDILAKDLDRITKFEI